MSIQLVTYANQTVTPTNDAIIYEKAIDQNGIFYGCNVTVTSNNVNITGGYGIICGREFVINSESIAVTLAPSGTLDGRLYVRLDLADADAPIQLLTATGNTLPALTQDDDVNYTNGTYEMELATFTVGVSSLSDVTETFKVIEGTAERDAQILDMFNNIDACRIAAQSVSVTVSNTNTMFNPTTSQVVGGGGTFSKGSNNRIVVNEDCTCIVMTSASFSSISNTDGFKVVGLAKNGTATAISTIAAGHPLAYDTMASVGTATLTAGDTLHFTGRSNTAAATIEIANILIIRIA